MLVIVGKSGSDPPIQCICRILELSASMRQGLYASLLVKVAFEAGPLRNSSGTCLF